MSEVYYAVFKQAGRQIRRSLKTTDRAVARSRLAELRPHIARLHAHGQDVLFADLAKRFLDANSIGLKVQSVRRLETFVRMVTPHFPQSVAKISRADIEQWASARAKERSPSTYNQERATLVRVIDYAVQVGLRVDNPARSLKRMKKMKPQIVIPTREQFTTLVQTIRTLDPRAHESADLVEFLGYSGCRLAEATEMRWGDIRFELKCFTVTGGEHGTKNGEARTVPLFPALERLLSRMQTALARPPKPTDRLFSIENGKKAIIAACKKAGLPHFLHHSMRHFFCSNAIETNIDFKVIAGWVGHKDGGVLVAQTYGHLRDEHSTAMAQRMTFDADAPATPV